MCCGVCESVRCAAVFVSLLIVCQANEDVTQIVKVLSNEPLKWSWLSSNLVQFTTGISAL